MVSPAFLLGRRGQLLVRTCAGFVDAHRGAFLLIGSGSNVTLAEANATLSAL